MKGKGVKLNHPSSSIEVKRKKGGGKKDARRSASVREDRKGDVSSQGRGERERFEMFSAKKKGGEKKEKKKIPL